MGLTSFKAENFKYKGKIHYIFIQPVVAVLFEHSPVEALQMSHRHFSEHCIPWNPRGHGLRHSGPKELLHTDKGKHQNTTL